MVHTSEETRAVQPALDTHPLSRAPAATAPPTSPAATAICVQRVSKTYHAFLAEQARDEAGDT
ncbi:MAG TPA: hypothetical protein VFS21_39715 [Roseiflexaceae bacterium]|nr:hypothetical protein [Roseiflexaceae bacterium]